MLLFRDCKFFYSSLMVHMTILRENLANTGTKKLRHQKIIFCTVFKEAINTLEMDHKCYFRASPRNEHSKNKNSGCFVAWTKTVPSLTNFG